MKRTLFAALATLALGGAAVSAHHSFAAEFDINKPVTLQGTVTKVEWVNPHVYVYLDVKDGSNFGFMRRMTFADGHTVELWLGDDEAKK